MPRASPCIIEEIRKMEIKSPSPVALAWRYYKREDDGLGELGELG